MNTNVILKCQYCDDIIHARVGFSNQEKQIFRFACRKCTSPIIIQLDLDFKQISFKVSIDGGNLLSENGPDCFDQSNQFVDLHLDYPTYYGEYQMGLTPFIRASQKLKENLLLYESCLGKLQLAVNEKENIKAIIRFYLTGNHVLFKKNVREYLDEKGFPCEKRIDINRALYQLLEIFFMGLTDPPSNAEFVVSVTKKLSDLHKGSEKEFGLFLHQMMDTDFLKNLQKDCLEIYGRVLDLNEIFRPALYYSFVEDDNKETSLRIANSDFSKHKDLFNDISEIISRQMSLIAGINNIDKRGKCNLFNSNTRNYPSNLDEFANRSFGNKSNYIDDMFWGEIATNVTKNRLRNAIAHYKIEYTEASQEIEYYFKPEGLKQQEHEKITFMDFTIILLDSFRWLHKFNHIIKMFYVFWFLKYEQSRNSPSRRGKI
jgi:hypothetical protein